MALVIVVNGLERTLEELNGETALDVVLEKLALQADRVAVEWNGAIARRRNWSATTVRTGDRLEIVHFVGGG